MIKTKIKINVTANIAMSAIVAVTVVAATFGFGMMAALLFGLEVMKNQEVKMTTTNDPDLIALIGERDLTGDASDDAEISCAPGATCPTEFGCGGPICIHSIDLNNPGNDWGTVQRWIGYSSRSAKQEIKMNSLAPGRYYKLIIHPSNISSTDRGAFEYQAEEKYGLQITKGNYKKYRLTGYRGEFGEWEIVFRAKDTSGSLVLGNNADRDTHYMYFDYIELRKAERIDAIGDREIATYHPQEINEYWNEFGCSHSREECVTVVGEGDNLGVRQWIGYSSAVVPSDSKTRTQIIQLKDLMPGQYYKLTVFPAYVSSDVDYQAKITDERGARISSGKQVKFYPGYQNESAKWEIIIQAQLNTASVKLFNGITTGDHYLQPDYFQFESTEMQEEIGQYEVADQQIDTAGLAGEFDCPPTNEPCKYILGESNESNIRRWIGQTRSGSRTTGVQIFEFTNLNPGKYYKLTVYPAHISADNSRAVDYLVAKESGDFELIAGESIRFDPGRKSSKDKWEIIFKSHTRTLGISLRNNAPVDSTNYMYFDYFQFGPNNPLANAVITDFGSIEPLYTIDDIHKAEKQVSFLIDFPRGHIQSIDKDSDYVWNIDIRTDEEERYVIGGFDFDEDGWTDLGIIKTIIYDEPFCSTDTKKYQYVDLVQGKNGNLINRVVDPLVDWCFVGRSISYPNSKYPTPSISFGGDTNIIAFAPRYYSEGYFKYYDGDGGFSSSLFYQPTGPHYDERYPEDCRTNSTGGDMCYVNNSNVSNGLIVNEAGINKFVVWTSGRVMEYSAEPLGAGEQYSPLINDLPYLTREDDPSGRLAELAGRVNGMVSMDPNYENHIINISGTSPLHIFRDMQMSEVDRADVDKRNGSNNAIERHMSVYNHVTKEIVGKRFFSNIHDYTETCDDLWEPGEPMYREGMYDEYPFDNSIAQCFRDRLVYPTNPFVKRQEGQPSRIAYNVFTTNTATRFGDWSIHVSDPLSSTLADDYIVPGYFLWDIRDIDGDGIDEWFVSPTRDSDTSIEPLNREYYFPKWVTKIYHWNEGARNIDQHDTLNNVIPYLMHAFRQPDKTSIYDDLSPVMTAYEDSELKLIMYNENGEIEYVPVESITNKIYPTDPDDLQKPEPIVFGDINQDGLLDITDVVVSLNVLFRQDLVDMNEIDIEMGNVNGDSGYDLADPIYILNHLFAGGPPPVQG